MKLNQSLITKILTLVPLLFLTQITHSDQAEYAAGGANCKAANLGQANLMMWDQFGVFNPSAIPLYVICTPQRDQPGKLAENLASGMNIAGMATGIFDPGAAGSVSCIWRVTDETPANALTFTNFMMTINDPNPGGAVRRVISNQVSLAPAEDPAQNDLWSTAVCALPPNTGIARIGFVFI